MAQCLLAEDRCHFFEGKGDYDEGVDIERMGKNDRDKEALPWLDVENLRHAAAADNDTAPAVELAEEGVPPILLDAQGQLCHILYVDDDELINDLVRRMLQRAGFPATLYTRSHEALEDVRTGKVHYDLAVVDYMMPGLNGLELARELRRLHPQRPVAITSGLISEELRRDAPQAGIAELIHKPNTGTELLQAISRLARRVVDQG